MRIEPALNADCWKSARNANLGYVSSNQIRRDRWITAEYGTIKHSEEPVEANFGGELRWIPLDMIVFDVPAAWNTP